MTRYIGTVARGIRAPIFKDGDDLAEMVPKLIINAANAEGYSIRNRDVIALTESIVARTQGNYATIEDIKNDVLKKLKGRTEIGLTLPILSRNRFSILLKGIAAATEKVIIQLSFPADEVGNRLFDDYLMIGSDINPWHEVLDEEQFFKAFGKTKHPFTGVDYISIYRDIVEEAGAECKIIFANDCRKILDYTKNVIACDIHTREQSIAQLKAAGAEFVIGLADILNDPTEQHGFNEEYGLLGSNKASETEIKLFPRDCQKIVDQIAGRMYALTEKNVEVMIYGDGAFKDPIGKIWELADPVVSPAFTPGLIGTPNELKLKYIADNEYKDLSSDEQKKLITKRIQERKALKDKPIDSEESEGTTPRQITDLLGSLSDLVSGSGDKGTPIVYIQGYFDNYAD